MTGDDYTWIFIFYDRQKPTKRRTNAQTYLVYIFIYPALPPKEVRGWAALPPIPRKEGRKAQPETTKTMYRPKLRFHPLSPCERKKE
jgi:hypothetical protein